MTEREPFGIGTFRQEIIAALGEEFWEELTEGLTLPDIETESGCGCGCCNMRRFMARFESMAGEETVRTILTRVRHGMQPDDAAWAREKLLELGGLDEFLAWHLRSEMENFERLNREKEDFYGQPVTDEVLEFLREHPAILAPVREGNILRCMAFPGDMQAYLAAEDNKMKRYYACHCPFARESILSEEPVSAGLCNCSLGHVMNFSEAFLNRKLSGRVVRSVLGGGLLCEYEITIPEDIMKEYVTEKEV